MRQEYKQKINSRKGKPHAVFIDLKSAFDNVNWERLIKKLLGYRYPMSIINSIRIMYQNAHATPVDLKYAARIKKGVLQGGILSPMLFSLYINDLAVELDKIGEIKSYFYADDLAMIIRGKRNINKALTIIEDWSKRNMMGVNNKKCGIMKLAKRPINKAKGDVKNNKVQIMDSYPLVEEYKYLGISFNQDLSVKTHLIKMEEKLKKFKKMIYIHRV